MGRAQVGGETGRAMDGNAREASTWKSGNNHLDLEAVERCSEEALKANPRNVEALYTLGKCHIENKDVDEAEAIVHRLLQLEKESYEACVLGGHVGLQRTWFDRSYENFLKAYYKATYRDGFLMYGISLFYEAIGDYPSARPWLVLLNKLGVEEYKSYEILFRTGVCLKKMNMIEDSTSVFRVIVYDPPNDVYDPNAQIQIAHLYEMQSKHDLAIEVLGEIKDPRKHYLTISRLYAWIDFKTGNFHGVRKWYRADNSTHSDPYLMYLVGRIKYMEGNYMGALKKYMRVVQMDLMGGMIHNSIGCVYFQQGRLASAREAFTSALEANPGLPEAAINLKLVERAMPENASEVSRSLETTSHNPREPPPSIGKTRYLDSAEFFRDSTFTVHPRMLGVILPMRTSRFELLPEWP
ncbi:hypothetical protein [Encephalitozoon cuniculi GB-M1]|uniref:Uncharacterized protein n=2 Tax=Encephalitozoon cuniculi TaxID=6035 RepID=Q8SUN0_ENCCU|nr:uncharacterized protein ECU08_1340 [Encephalitozoon cuniculi GB-M1]AGE95058.1 hypothetical protein ECU08_1340 [Encephalitozoon cuniculi]KMV65663.1 hypothetical protein M970_081380 [Encephalitozoon cuniculi EcunIII-L]UYI27066.1 UDP-N-acetylglucosamine--peptide N- acetylglucosaminyltransferase [Encephalitozoon cuniculi]CAD26439.1 hypothetical protein [Encephalitozoon cuniculi GB-M1]